MVFATRGRARGRCTALGDVRQSSIAEIWNGERARRFRERRRQGLPGACHRCVARHMADVRN
jgi:hypothetical protein